MITIQKYIELYPRWFDGSDTTDKKIRTALKSGRIKGRKYGKAYKIEVPNEAEPLVTETVQDLKNRHLITKIKKDEQYIYETRILLCHKVLDLVLEELFNTKIGLLCAIATKHLNEEGRKAWNQEIQTGWNRNSENFITRLKVLVLE